MQLHRLLFTLIIISASVSLQAQKWSKTNVTGARSVIENEDIPNKYIGYELDFNSLLTVLEGTRSESRQILLPNPEGIMELFMIQKSDVFHPDLSVRYPGIKSFKGYSLDVPGSYIRMGYGQERMHAMILRDGKQTTYIDYIKGSKQQYAVYYKSDYGQKDRHQFECLVAEEDRLETDEGIATTRHGDCQLRKYRLALSCTGEYASFHGGTIESVLAEYNVAMTRVNGLYERDAGITMELVPNTDELIFLDASSDPFTNNNGGVMLGQNQNTVDDIIGFANYDIGHVFSTGGGGIASLRSPCSNRKAQGVTGLGSPINDPFYIDYVAHEMGHQFGGNHSYNNSCSGNRNNSTAMEPGSGSTIMGYAGICGPNVQNNSDDHFHGVNLIEIANFVTGSGNSCAEIIPTMNNAPEVTVANVEVTIPANTTFFLTADASDADGDLMTYCWEQMDNEIETMPPQGNSTGGPLFRSYSPTEDSRRFFPQRSGSSTWEVLPTVSREMNFMCTVRDNNTSVGCTGEANITVNVIDTGAPFMVTSPNTSVTWAATDLKTVTWDVAGTDQEPINTAEVDIFLSIDGGETFDIVLATNTENDGSEEIIVPNTPTGSARVVIVGSDNVFYDMSDVNFSITEEFSVSISPFSQVACGQDELIYTANLMSASTFSDIVSLSVDDLPDGATASISENMVSTPASVEIMITGLSNVEAGSYLASLTATAGEAVINEIFAINVQNDDLQISNGMAPEDGATGLDPTSVEFVWNAQEGVSIYQFQLTTSPDFESAPIATATPTSSTTIRSGLEKGTVYYWRVRARSICSTGAYSEVQAFRTSSDGCVQYTSESPVIIPLVANVEVDSEVEVLNDIDFSKAKVILDVSHTFIGDLSAKIISPSNESFDLFDRPGVPSDEYGCSRDDIEATFSNSAELTAIDFEAECDQNPAIEGEYQPLSMFTTTPSLGVWTLTVTDVFQADEGVINSWSIESCTEVVFPDVLTAGSKNIVVINGRSSIFDNSTLVVESQDEVVMYITDLPSEGVLMRGTEEILEEGSEITEEELADGSLSYMHSGNEATTDMFSVDIQVPSTGAWIRKEEITIDILENTFQVVGNITNEVSCFEGSDGEVLATAVEGVEPYEFSLDNINFQMDPNFVGLSSGEYIVYVKDAEGNESESELIVIEEPDPILLNTLLIGYTITANAEGGAGGFEYSIDGVNFNSTGQFLDLENGDYIITVKDNNDCTASNEVNVNIDVLDADISTIDLDCANIDNGVITVVANGGISPYEYSINESDFSIVNGFADLPAATYSISVRDAGGRVVQYDNVMVSSTPPITYTYTLNMDDVVINAMGGTAPYMYSTNGVDFQSENVLNIDLTEDYVLTISDAKGCLFIFDLSISSITAVSLSTVDVCFGEVNGSIIIDGITGGVGPYQYSINEGPFQSESVFVGLSGGIYDVAIKDANGSEYIEVGVVINENPEIQLEHNTSTDTLYVNGIGGAESAYSYSINGEGFNEDGFFTNLPDGDYTVVVMDATGCVEEFVIMFTDVEDVLAEGEIKIYPNPAIDNLAVELSDITNKLQSISIVSIDGKSVLNQKYILGSHKQIINVSDLTDGLYIMYVKTEKGTIYQRISVMK